MPLWNNPEKIEKFAGQITQANNEMREVMQWDGPVMGLNGRINFTLGSPYKIAVADWGNDASMVDIISNMRSYAHEHFHAAEHLASYDLGYNPQDKVAALSELDLHDHSHGHTTYYSVAYNMTLASLGVSNKHGKLGRVRHLKRYARRLRQANKAVARKRKGSGRWKAACRRLGKVHTRVANVREATLKQAATRIADRSAIVCVETLLLAFMAKNSRLAKSIYDLGWASFLRYLEDAMAARGHLLLYAGQFTPTTQACSTQGCGYINRTLKNNLSLRAWDCPKCGTHHDRDVNAAQNIQEDAIRRLLESNGAESALSRPSIRSCGRFSHVEA